MDDLKKSKNELIEEKNTLFVALNKTITENDDLKKQFREKSQECTDIWVRDLQIEYVLESKTVDSEKIENIQKLMKQVVSTKPSNHNIVDNKEYLMILVENNRLAEQQSLLEQQFNELKLKHSNEIEGLTAQLKIEHDRAVKLACGFSSTSVPPPVPPRKSIPNTNPFLNGTSATAKHAFLISCKMHPTEASSVQASGENLFKLSVDDARELSLLKDLLWGRAVQDVVFRFWSQGFELSKDETSALVQHTGGPCSVIAACQAYILKHLMELPGIQFKDLTEDKCRKVLVQAICNILSNCKESTVFKIVTLDKSNDVNVEKAQEAAENEEESIDHQQQQRPDSHNSAMETSLVTEDRGLHENDELPPNLFHECLVINEFESIEEVEKFFVENYTILSNRYGVLLFLYSVLLTKGIEKLLSEISDTSEPLIHSQFGYGSQSLINLFLTGRAVAHVFDNDQDIGGMKLKGIDKQSDIGFITLMEQLRYCTVGSFFKNPKFPVWILASETHLTVLFSNEKSLVSPETAAEQARRVFSQYDTENTGFISSSVLQDILSSLGLESDPDYVEIMRKKLDADGTSIILLSDFMYEFFPEDKKSTPDTFELFHYNGIPNSNEFHKVRYSHGQAILLESHTSEMFSQSNQMLTVLQTKWPSIEINWNQDRIPSLN